ncbi:methyl-accepting chemotaxis protein [Massilia sp. PWRC2]|uniref:methyl-accepting chemotaxis protein n=1 Tax=Massilia sp. PWRC2 TaxID=2804626 RepID=UPI003CF66BD2
MFTRSLLIGQRLALGFAVVIALLLLMGTLACLRVDALKTEVRLASDVRFPQTELIHTVKDELNETARNMRNLLLLSDPEVLKSENANIEQSARDIEQALNKLDKTITSPQGRALYDDIQAQRTRFLAEQKVFLDLTGAQRRDDAIVHLSDKLRPLSLKYFDALDKMVAFQAGLMNAAGSAASASAQATLILLIGLALAAALAAVLAAWLVTRSITAPIGQAVAMARRVASGDLSGAVVVGRRDETGQLLQALSDMNGSLVTIVGEVRSSTDTIATASSQIAAGNLDLSARTEQQAASLEETASSMEEMAATVKQNADNARQANQLAITASRIAVKGGDVVANVVGTMGSINEASRKIVDIIAVIDSIAFQTNILALNAAVEAARAGEQGRGFAVVASEVRSLAQRSASAAKEIKGLIDASVAQVDIGQELVQEAGSTMTDLVASVQRVTDIMAEISSANHEQEAGIAQINLAVTEMDGMTAQNAALVEQASAAATSLQQQATQLSAVVSVFKMRAETPPAPTTPASAPVRMNQPAAAIKPLPAAAASASGSSASGSSATRATRATRASGSSATSATGATATSKPRRSARVVAAAAAPPTARRPGAEADNWEEF